MKNGRYVQNTIMKLMKNIYFARATLRSRGIRPAKRNNLLEEDGYSIAAKGVKTLGVRHEYNHNN